MNTHHYTNFSSVGRARPDRPSHPAASRAHTSAALPVRTGNGAAEEPSDETVGGFSHILRSLPVTFVLTALAGLALVTVAAAVAYNSPDPSPLTTPLAAIALAITSLVGGILAGKRNRNSPVLGGLTSGCLFAAVLTVLSLLLGGATDAAVGFTPAVAWFIRLGTVVLHGLGGFLVRPRQKPVTHTAGKHPAHRR